MEERISAEEYRALISGRAPKAKRIRLPRIAQPSWSRDGHLERLMSAPTLGSVKLGPEDHLAIEFADLLRKWTLRGNLKAVWTHVANEVAGGSKNARIRYAIAKRLGLAAGASDYMFLWGSGSAALEAKAPGKLKTQNHNQKDFEAWCQSNDVPYYLFDSVAAGTQILVDLGILHLDKTCTFTDTRAQ